MTRLILTAICGTTLIGLAACGYNKDEYNDQAGYNAEESNYTAENTADYGNMSNDMNMTDMNGMNATGNATGNAAIDNGSGY